MTRFSSSCAHTLCAFVYLAFAASSQASLATGPQDAHLIWGPYLSFADSPFAGGTYEYFLLEDFEDGALNTPGATARGGLVLGPGPLTDSVDGDSGPIDGLGTSGTSYYCGGASSLEFTFSTEVLGTFPTHVGLAWTDVGFSDLGLGYDTVTFEAFGPDGMSLGTLDLNVGDGDFTGQTAEDRFFGVVHAGGVSRITLTSRFSDDWEMDHLQFGAEAHSVPVPGALALTALGMLIARFRRTGLATA